MGSGVLGDEQDARVASAITRTRPNRHARQIMGRPYVSSTNQRVQVEACGGGPRPHLTGTGSLNRRTGGDGSNCSPRHTA
jgi:hypothetical protein